MSIGSLIGGALSLGSSLVGAWQASKAAKKANELIKKQRQANQNWYDRRYNEDATQRADAQRVLQLTADNIRSRNRAAAGTQAVMGGTAERVAAERAANNQALADAASRIAAAGEARKDEIENQYLTNENALNQQLVGTENSRATNIAKATSEASKAASLLPDMFKEED